MKALLWKDYRVNRMVLAYALAMLLGVYLVAVVVNAYAQWRYGVALKAWSELLFLAAMMSLILELPTAAMLGGCAFAAERADRSTEFLAYLPISRGKALASKITLAVGVLAIVWLINAAILLLLETRIAASRGLGDESALRTLGIMASISIGMFGVAWLVSSFSSSHALAAAVGILAPIACTGGIFMIAYLFDLPDSSVERLLPRICVATGSLSFLGGIACYARRVEP